MKLRQIALDTETTGLEPSKGHRIIEIGCIELIDRRLTGNTFHAYINPDREVEFGAAQVHGITNEFLADKPRFADIFAEFKAFIDGAQLVIHNAAFDVGFINHEFKLHDKRLQTVDRYCSIVDTLAMARTLHPGQKNSLDALCKRYGIDNAHRTLHGGLMDAQLLARVYLAMTGGQTALGGFVNTGNRNQAPTEFNNAMLEHTRQFTITQLSAEELEAHQQRTAQIAKKNRGVNLWEQES